MCPLYVVQDYGFSQPFRKIKIFIFLSCFSQLDTPNFHIVLIRNKVTKYQANPQFLFDTEIVCARLWIFPAIQKNEKYFLSWFHSQTTHFHLVLTRNKVAKYYRQANPQFLFYPEIFMNRPMSFSILLHLDTSL